MPTVREAAKIRCRENISVFTPVEGWNGECKVRRGRASYNDEADAPFRTLRERASRSIEGLKTDGTTWASNPQHHYRVHQGSDQLADCG